MAITNVYDPLTKTYTSGTPEVLNNAMSKSGAIAIDALTNSSKVVVPPNTSINPYAGLGSSTVLTPPPTYTPPTPISAEDKYANDLAGLPTPPSQESLQSELEKKYQIEEKTKTANALKAQIDTNTAEAEAAKLSQEGRLSSIGAISGAQRDIDRQLAIKNLPLTAQYQASLGDLQGAQNSVEKLFTAKLADAKAQYDRAKDLIDSAYTVASAKEKKLLDAKKIEEDRKYQETQDKIAFDREKEMAKYKYQLDAQFNPPTNPTVPTVKTINGVDKQWNPQTQTWDDIGATVVNDNTQKSIDQLQFLRDTAKKATDIAGASGASGISKFLGDVFVGDTKFRQLEALTNTLKTNVLSLMTDPNIKKFFGPQMSNADVLLMTSAGTTLNPNANTSTQMKDEIKRLDDLFNRMQTAVKNNGVSKGTTITGPDGNVYQITD
jgi:hypothetical protein